MYNYFCEIEKPQLRLVSAKIAMETIFGQNLLLFTQCYSAITKTSLNYLVQWKIAALGVYIVSSVAMVIQGAPLHSFLSFIWYVTSS